MEERHFLLYLAFHSKITLVVLVTMHVPLFILILKKMKKKIKVDLETGILMFDRVMTFSKSCGGVGVLIGFVLLCQNLNDPVSIGPAQILGDALSILYALTVAYVIYLPVKTKLECHVKNLVAQMLWRH